ncbi:MAG: hypothetical protein IJP52_00100 [Paludibacteraceae bacterium]|nr:hypothetical protein [Paludibacteraceae bacterium]
MRRRATIILCVLMTAIGSLSASKLFPDEYHFISLWGSAGYSTLLHNSSEIKAGPGFAPSIGVGYRYYHTGFIMQLGVEGQYALWTNKLNTSSLTMNMRDTEGDVFSMKASVNESKDRMHAINVNIPILFGYEYHRIYFLAGVGAGLNVWAQTSSHSSVTTMGDYERFIDPFVDMPNHGFTRGKSVDSKKYDVQMNLNLMLHAEIGARVDRFYKEKGADVPKHKYRMYVAAFADYGILNVHKNKDYGQALSYNETSEGLQFYVVPAMVSSQLYNKRVTPLTIGVKFTVLFELPKPKVCLMCREN